VDSLTREVALIQGPPGTGKVCLCILKLTIDLHRGRASAIAFRKQDRVSYNVSSADLRPIVLLAFTNHALDHILRAVHDTGVTKDIVRLGSRSKDDVVSEYSLEAIEMVRNKKTSLHGEVGKHIHAMKDLEAVSTH
jgi:hypothetical protein